jgi:hypothetical protein
VKNKFHQPKYSATSQNTPPRSKNGNKSVEIFGNSLSVRKCLQHLGHGIVLHSVNNLEFFDHLTKYKRSFSAIALVMAAE